MVIIMAMLNVCMKCNQELAYFLCANLLIIGCFLILETSVSTTYLY